IRLTLDAPEHVQVPAWIAFAWDGSRGSSMSSLTLRRIHLGEPKAADQLARLRSELGAQGTIVSERGRALTRKVFGAPLTPQQVAERVGDDARRGGLAAVLEYPEPFARARLTADTLRVTPSEMHLAHAAADPGFLETVRRVRQNVLSFQLGLLHRD